MSSPRLDLVAGCNGAGKSTLIRTLLRPALPGSTYVNADDIAHSKWPGDEEKKSYEAARLADHARTTLLEHGHPFITETVFSHPSKLELIDEAIGLGFRVVLHIVMVPEEVAVRRVHSRVLSGGHSVPEDKIRARYQRPLLAAAVCRSTEAFVYDNGDEQTVLVAEFERGFATAAAWPAWTPAAISALTPAV
ncbi:MAG TPA: zeta toxin family protein [Gordonia sp. (in: high G+C Gram-positive bacteria)]|uniref:zeta toxin family protein n=1 Tax=unclassified Gordonia (in: high G+C Gram-positive bacteria) TaxID=2657482 RepID=UPI000FA59B5A|nr:MULTISPECIES: zeta toxin family protein [unclassified Gordonia (in: high G+C Gram-positive bacteria)]RUP37098.1 MAG: ATPase [Gordonia sp. (in: high G+C Gram-positive bacteria)]HNP55463.1 zeta toxin family protein [Gordonia sp. (in: high G+C Gram-positive bacteria)]HRC50120.1 zeta toxin family protein [Gordonia sp. (in: high G+C Gram-positive bacteria)]